MGGGGRQRQYGHLTQLLTEVGRRQQRVCLGSRIGFLAETGPQVTITAPRVRYFSLLFYPLSSFMLFSLSLPLFYFPFPFPPSLCQVSVLLSFALLRPCSNLSFSSTYVRFPSINTNIIGAFYDILGVICIVSHIRFYIVVVVMFHGLAYC